MNYLLIVLILFICCLYVLIEKYLPVKNRIFVYSFFSIILSVFFANRELSSPDTIEYVSVFNRSNLSDGLFDRIERFEGGYCALNRIVHQFTANYVILFFLISIFNYLALLYFIKNDERIKIWDKDNSYKAILPVSFLLVYTAYYGLLYNGIVMRACIAIPLVYVSAMKFRQKRFVIGSLAFVASCFFHQASLLALPIVLVYYFNLKIKKKTGIKIVMTLLILYLLGIGQLTSKAVSYVVMFLYNRFPNVSLFWWSYISLAGKNVEGDISLYKLFSFLLLLGFLCFDDREKFTDKHTLISIIGIVILTLFSNLEIMIRLAEYYLVSFCFAIHHCIATKDKTICFKIFGKGFRLPKSPLVLLVSVFYLVIFIRNVVLV